MLFRSDPAAFCEEINRASHQSLGPLSLISERKTWPLQKAQARQWSGRCAGGAVGRGVIFPTQAVQ